MGRVTTPTYRVEYRTNKLALGLIASDCASNVDGLRVLMMAWRKWNGRPTKSNLEQWRKDWNASFRPGQVNAALNDHINWARVIRQRDQQIMCETQMPMFEVA